MVLRQSLVGGRRAAFFSVFGNSTGLIIWASLSSVGLSAIFAHSHLAFNILKSIGVAFLLGLAIQTLFQLRNEYGKFDIDGTPPVVSETRATKLFRTIGLSCVDIALIPCEGKWS